MLQNNRQQFQNNNSFLNKNNAQAPGRVQAPVKAPAAIPAKKPADDVMIPDAAVKLKNIILDMTEASLQMKDAIIHRNVDKLWQIMLYQEEKMADFEHYNLLWRQLCPASGEVVNPAFKQINEDLNAQIKAMRRQNSSNLSLAHSFLAVINKVFRKAGMDNAVKTGYGNNGKVKLKSSMIISREG